MEQEAYWVTGWGIHMPWIGLDQQGCGYLKHNCTAETVTDVQKFSYPINIMKEYPRVSLKLKRRNHLQSLSHLFCTLISENQGLDKSRSVSNLIKISVPVYLNFFFSAPDFFFQFVT